MAPQVTDWEELLFLSDEINEETGDFQYTTFAIVENDMIYFSQLNRPKADISLQ